MKNQSLLKLGCSILFLFQTSHSQIHAQEIVVSGQVTDTLDISLPYANVLAKPTSVEEELAFAITDDKGNYQLKLRSNTNYEIEFSYIGFKTKKWSILIGEKDVIKKIRLSYQVNELNEVVVIHEIPIIIKKDTIIYNVDSFSNGKERKLREIIKRLPGAEVDRAGNVMVNGRKIIKVLVEGKTFFSGNSKLAVNNIPADAIDKIEILDNYSEVAILKEFQQSGELAMNIKLKEDKKKFVFGEVENGIGVKDRYLLHPTLFYYNTKTNFNFIGDYNNTGTKSFTLNDYLEFEGGLNRLLEDTGSYFNLYNDDFAKFLGNQNFKNSNNIFGAINFKQTVGQTTDISSYIIASGSNTKSETISQINYVSSDVFSENRSKFDNRNNKFLIAKILVENNNTANKDIKFSSTFKLIDNDVQEKIQTNNPFQANTIATLINNKSFSLGNNFSYSKKFSKKHTTTFQLNLNIDNNKPEANWSTDVQILNNILPLEEDETFRIKQIKGKYSKRFNGLLKHYWILNGNNHVYTSIGFDLWNNQLSSSEEQLFANGVINNFSSAGFGNEIAYNLQNTFIGLEYKIQSGIFIFKPSLYFNRYTWQTDQTNILLKSSKQLILPQFSAKVELNDTENITFDYKIKARFPEIDKLANNFILQGFNQVNIGDETIENELYHTSFLNYYKFSIFDKLHINGSLNYVRKLNSIKNSIELNGIDQLGRAILFNRPEQNIAFRGSIAKKYGDLKFTLKGTQGYSDFFQIINQLTNKNISSKTSGSFQINTYFDKWPQFKFLYKRKVSNYRTELFDSKFNNDDLQMEMEYVFLNDFVFKMDYLKSRYENVNNNVINDFDVLNASLEYGKEDSSWRFEISGSNLLNIQFKQLNSFSEIVISDKRIFVMPRIVMLKVFYKI